VPFDSESNIDETTEIMSQPKIHDLGMLDTEYAQLLAAGHDPLTGEIFYDRSYIQQRVRHYAQSTTQRQRDALLYRIATNAEIFTVEDVEEIEKRNAELTPELRQQVWSFLKKKGISMASPTISESQFIELGISCEEYIAFLAAGRNPL
jgi:hypothetical protein